MADAAMTTMSAFSVPVTGPRAVIRIQLTPVARPAAPEPVSWTLVDHRLGDQRHPPGAQRAPQRYQRRPGLATTGQPKLLQNPQLLQTCWSL